MILILCSLALHCAKVNNKYDINTVRCGSPQMRSTPYFMVADEDGELIPEGEYELIPIVNTNQTLFSSQSCVEIPESAFLVRSRQKGIYLAKVFSKDNLPESGSVENLENVDDQSITVSCNPESTRINDFSRFVSQVISPQIKAENNTGFRLGFDFLDDKIANSSTEFTSEFFSSDFIKSTDFSDGSYQLTITIHNDLSTTSTSHSCPFIIDTELPSATPFAKQTKTMYRGQNLSLVSPAEEIRFQSNDTDISYIEYCTQRIDENSLSPDIQSLSNPSYSKINRKIRTNLYIRRK